MDRVRPGEEIPAGLWIPELAALPAAHGPSPGAWCVSLAIHLFLIYSLPVMGGWLPRPPPRFASEQERDRERNPIIVWVPPERRLVRELPPAPPKRGRRLAGASAAAATPPESPSPAPRRSFVLPGQGVSESQLLLVYPTPQVADRRSVRQLPSLAVWTGALPPPAEVAMPGARHPAPPVALPDVKPDIAPPVDNAPPAEVSIPKPKRALSKLTLPAQSAVPLAAPAFEEVPIVPAQPGQSQPGTPLSVIAITGNLPAPGRPVMVPQVQLASARQNTKTEEVQSNAAGEAGRVAGESSAGAGPAQGGSGQSTGSSAERRAGQIAGGSADGGSATNHGPVGKAEAHDPNSGNSGGTETAQPGAGPVRNFTLASPKGAIRVTEFGDGSRHINYPEDGDFDVVVLGAGLPPGLPPSETVLKGKPIYTTYIQVGAGRDWILQFCPEAAPAAAPKRSGMVVNLGSVPRLEAPYVQFAIIPAAHLAGVKYMSYYFRISSEGKVHDVRLLGGAESQASLVSKLASWRFRSAMRDGKPLSLEAILLVPPVSLAE